MTLKQCRHLSLAMTAAISCLLLHAPATRSAEDCPYGCFGTITTPEGWGTTNTQTIGDTDFTTINGPGGRITTCTTTRIGGQTFTNCY